MITPKRISTEQDHEYRVMVNGVIQHHVPGISLAIEWLPGTAFSTRAALQGVVDEIMASIADHESVE